MNSVKWKDVPTRTIDVGGVPFAYRDLGPDSGVPVIFLHHLMAVLDDWDPRVIEAIAAHRRVIAFDNRGVGASGGSVPHSVEEMGRDAIAFIRALGPKKVIESARSLSRVLRSSRPPSARWEGGHKAGIQISSRRRAVGYWIAVRRWLPGGSGFEQSRR